MPIEFVESLVELPVGAGDPYDGNRLALKELKESNVGVGVWLLVDCEDKNDMVGDRIGGIDLQRSTRDKWARMVNGFWAAFKLARRLMGIPKDNCRA